MRLLYIIPIDVSGREEMNLKAEVIYLLHNKEVFSLPVGGQTIVNDPES
jgi:hypothetical protein